MLGITVHAIKGHCPVYERGNRIVIENPTVLVEERDAVCMHALPTIFRDALILEYS